MTEGRLVARVRRLEERLAALEERDAGRATDHVSAVPAGGEATPDPAVFWALEGLKSRVPQPGAVLFTGTVTLPTGERFDWQEAVTVEELLGADWSASTDVLAALAHPVRLALLHAVLRGVRSVADLGSLDGLGTTGQLYHHLRQLVAAGWLRLAGRGRYEVPASRVVPMLVITMAGRR